ncbi:MAG TPA: metallophosphoesterase family protein [Luteibaculaceae bacterium]|nr:metallophosphoesterase family protein [Luteibaculaceae bacterium]
MKIALFSDIHANLPALTRFFEETDSQDLDAIYCLGDLVGYNIWPNEVIREIHKRKIPTIAGNYDFGIGRTSDECGCAYKTEEDQAMGKQSIAFTNAAVGDWERAYLRRLPAHIRLEYQLNDDNLHLLMVHGSPRKINEYLFEDREEKSLLRIMQQAQAHVMCFGHTHKPFHRVLWDEESKCYRHAINLGSIGKPKDGDPRGCYVIIELDQHSTLLTADGVNVTFQRFTYDVEQAARAVEASVLPNAYADMLRLAY